MLAPWSKLEVAHLSCQNKPFLCAETYQAIEDGELMGFFSIFFGFQSHGAVKRRLCHPVCMNSFCCTGSTCQDPNTSPCQFHTAKVLGEHMSVTAEGCACAADLQPGTIRNKSSKDAGSGASFDLQL